MPIPPFAPGGILSNIKKRSSGGWESHQKSQFTLILHKAISVDKTTGHSTFDDLSQGEHYVFLSSPLAPVAMLSHLYPLPRGPDDAVVADIRALRRGVVYNTVVRALPAVNQYLYSEIGRTTFGPVELAALVMTNFSELGTQIRFFTEGEKMASELVTNFHVGGVANMVNYWATQGRFVGKLEELYLMVVRRKYIPSIEDERRTSQVRRGLESMTPYDTQTRLYYIEREQELAERRAARTKAIERVAVDESEDAPILPRAVPRRTPLGGATSGVAEVYDPAWDGEQGALPDEPYHRKLSINIAGIKSKIVELRAVVPQTDETAKAITTFTRRKLRFMKSLKAVAARMASGVGVGTKRTRAPDVEEKEEEEPMFQLPGGDGGGDDEKRAGRTPLTAASKSKGVDDPARKKARKEAEVALERVLATEREKSSKFWQIVPVSCPKGEIIPHALYNGAGWRGVLIYVGLLLDHLPGRAHREITRNQALAEATCFPVLDGGKAWRTPSAELPVIQVLLGHRC
jgi:hypothetical protein